jgi:hypothetical protein
MHIAREDVDVKMEIPGAVIRQQLDSATRPGWVASARSKSTPTSSTTGRKW